LVEPLEVEEALFKFVEVGDVVGILELARGGEPMTSSQQVLCPTKPPTQSC